MNLPKETDGGFPVHSPRRNRTIDPVSIDAPPGWSRPPNRCRRRRGLRVTSRAAHTVGYVVPLWLRASTMAPLARRKSCGAMAKFFGSMLPWAVCIMPRSQFELMANTLSFGKVRFKSAANCWPTSRARPDHDRPDVCQRHQ